MTLPSAHALVMAGVLFITRPPRALIAAGKAAIIAEELMKGGSSRGRI